MHTIEHRWRQHVNASRRAGRGGYCRLFSTAIRKYGPEAFDHEVLEIVRGREAADAAEARWIAVLGTVAPGGYNLRAGGNTAPVHPETRKRQSKNTREHAARIGPEARRAIAAARERRMTPEEKAARESSRLNALSRRWESLSPEQREEWRRKIDEPGRAARAARTKEQRRETARKVAAASSHERHVEMGKKSWVAKSPEVRERFARLGTEAARERFMASTTAEERVEKARRASEARWARTTPAQRREKALQAWVIRRSKLGGCSE